MYQDFYPPVNFYFSLSISGIRKNVDNAFQEVSGLSASVKVLEIEEGGVNNYKHKVPIRTEYENLVLKRGYVANDSDLYSWCEKSLSQTLFQLRDIDLLLLNEDGSILSAWNFKNAWPVKWSIGNFNAQDGAVLIETMEFVYSFFEKTPVPASPSTELTGVFTIEKPKNNAS